MFAEQRRGKPLLYLNISVERRGESQFEITWCDHSLQNVENENNLV